MLYNDLKIFHDALQLPMYVYKTESPARTELLYTFPAAAESFPLPAVCLWPVEERRYGLFYISTELPFLFSHLPLAEERLSLLIGPVSQFPFSRQDLRQLEPACHVRPQQREDFSVFLRSIPQHTPNEFSRILTMLNLHFSPQQMVDVRLQLPESSSDTLLGDSIRSVYENRTIENTNDSLEFEVIVLDIVEHGRVEKLYEFLRSKNISDVRPGTLAQTPLRNSKDLQIALITLLTRAAIHGGLEAQLALQLSDRYIQKVEAAVSQPELDTLQFDALLNFTTEVARVRRDHTANAGMNQILTYIRNHTNLPLTVSSIADLFGYNPNYLSTRFKKELGFGLSDFIYRTRLEEARQLLIYTNKSLLEISQYLCFADQSHFQKKFKAQYGLTPLAYRRINQSSSLAQP